MASSSTEFDYDDIIKQLIKKDIVTEKLEDQKNVLDSKRWAALRSYYESKGKFELAENTNNVVKTMNSDKSKMRNNIDQEHAFLDQKLELLQQLHTEMKAKSKNQSEIFFGNMDRLYHDFQKLPDEFDNENMHLTIQNLQNSLHLHELEIANANNEMEILKSSMENFETADDLSDLKVVTEIIQKESFEKYGDPMEIQHRLSEVRRNNEVLVKKIQELKVKYGI